MSSNKRRAIATAILLAIVVGVIAAIAIPKWAEKKQRQESWAEEYMRLSASYATGFDQLPASIEEWQVWSSNSDIDKLTGDDSDVIGENRLGTLAQTYSMLAKINIAAPENQECRELFERLTPYFQKAFVWEEGTTAGDCLKRLKSLGSTDVMGNIDTLAQQVEALYESSEADRWFTIATDGDLQMLPERYEYVTSDGDLYTYVEHDSSDSDLQLNP